jgi:hypothetical protein
MLVAPPITAPSLRCGRSAVSAGLASPSRIKVVLSFLGVALGDGWSQIGLRALPPRSAREQLSVKAPDDYSWMGGLSFKRFARTCTRVRATFDSLRRT